MSAPTAIRWVGVDLQETETTRAIVEAIEADNADITIKHFPGMVKIQSPGPLTINRSTVEEKFGRPWETHEFQLAIISYAGNIANWDDDEIVIKWEH